MESRPLFCFSWEKEEVQDFLSEIVGVGGASFGADCFPMTEKTDAKGEERKRGKEGGGGGEEKVKRKEEEKKKEEERFFVLCPTIRSSALQT